MSSSISKGKRIFSGGNVQESSSSLFFRKWEELDIDLLKIIFTGVPTVDLITNVASVCRSWKFACFDVLFWGPNQLDLTPAMFAQQCVRSNPLAHCFNLPRVMEAFCERMNVALMQILKSILTNGRDAYGFSLEQWRLSIKSIVIPQDLQISDHHLSYLAERTPNIESLVIIGTSKITPKGFAKAISTWKKVKDITFGLDKDRSIEPFFKEILKEIGENCPQLVTLRVKCFEAKARYLKHLHPAPTRLTKYAAKAMITILPQVNKLVLEGVEVRFFEQFC